MYYYTVRLFSQLCYIIYVISAVARGGVRCEYARCTNWCHVVVLYGDARGRQAVDGRCLDVAVPSHIIVTW